MQGAIETANFIQLICNWWQTVNVSNKGKEKRFKDPYRAVQDEASTNLVTFLNKFEGA